MQSCVAFFEKNSKILQGEAKRGHLPSREMLKTFESCCILRENDNLTALGGLHCFLVVPQFNAEVFFCLYV